MTGGPPPQQPDSAWYIGRQWGFLIGEYAAHSTKRDGNSFATFETKLRVGPGHSVNFVHP